MNLWDKNENSPSPDSFAGVLMKPFLSTLCQKKIDAGREKRHFNNLTGGAVSLTHILDKDLRREQWTTLNPNKTPNEILDNFIKHYRKSDNT